MLLKRPTSVATKIVIGKFDLAQMAAGLNGNANARLCGVVGRIESGFGSFPDWQFRHSRDVSFVPKAHIMRWGKNDAIRSPRSRLKSFLV